MGLISKEASLPSNGNQQGDPATKAGVATAEAFVKAAKMAEEKSQPSAKDRSIALQVGLKVAGAAMTHFASDPDQWLVLTAKMGRALMEEILR